MTPEERAEAAERRAAAAEAGLPAELADRLRGTTAAELAADAKSLLKHLAPASDTPPPPSFDGGPRGGPVGAQATSGQLAQEIIARAAAAGRLPGYVPPAIPPAQALTGAEHSALLGTARGLMASTLGPLR